MASANLDLQDLNVLLSTYTKDRLELKKEYFLRSNECARLL